MFIDAMCLLLALPINFITGTREGTHVRNPQKRKINAFARSCFLQDSVGWSQGFIFHK